MKNILNNNTISYKNKEEFLALLLILERQEKQGNQELDVVSLQKDD